MRTFYYKMNTYRIPDDRTIQELIVDLKKNPYIVLQRFKEERCMAPYFIEEDVQNVLIKIEDTERIIESESFIYSNEEYEKILREHVAIKCPGCVRYDGEVKNLERNNMVMTMNGICLQRKEERFYNFKSGVEAFWNKFTTMEEELRFLVRGGQIEEARNKVKEIFNRHVGAFGEILFGIDKQYTVLMLSGLNHATSQCVLHYVVGRAPDQLREQWVFLNYISRDFYQYQPSGMYDASENPVQVKRKRIVADRNPFDITFVSRWETEPEDEVNIENYLYLCSQIGENLLQNVACSINFSSLESFDESISLKEFYAEILDSYPSHEIHQFRVAANMYSYQFTPGPRSMIRGSKQKSFTSCRDLTFKVVLYEKNKELDAYLKQLNLICAFLEITLTGKEEEDRRRADILFKETIAELESLGLIKVFGYEYSYNRLYFDFLVMEAESCRKEIRKRAPELERFECIYTEIVEDGRKTYPVNYELNEIHDKDPRLN